MNNKSRNLFLVCPKKKEELNKYPTLVPDITADELVDKIKEDEDADRFTCNEWLNDIDQEIFLCISRMMDR